ncbi:MAG: hypothetical protein ACP5NL_06030 [Thermoplasmata archaeon]
MLSIKTALVTLIIALFVLINIAAFSSAATPVNIENQYSVASVISNSSFPNITIHFINGKTYSITGQDWKNHIMPFILYDRQVSKFNWSTTNEANYIFFDYSLRGLNPFGAEFIFALERYSSVTNATIVDALLAVRPLPSVNAPYTNGQALDLGILPGLPSTSLIKSTNVAQYYPEIVIISLIALVIILHYVFKKF